MRGAPNMRSIGQFEAAESVPLSLFAEEKEDPRAAASFFAKRLATFRELVFARCDDRAAIAAWREGHQFKSEWFVSN